MKKLNSAYKKGQTASEYLATYGWALLIVFFVIVYLISSGLFNPTRFMNEECTFQPDLPCLAHYSTLSNDKKINLAFRLNNGMGFPILLKSCNAWVAPQGPRTAGECKDIYLEPGEDRFLIINGIRSFSDISERSIQKILVELEFRSCKNYNIEECKNLNLPSYITQGKIITQLIGGNPFSSLSFGSCLGGAKRCNGNIVQSCEYNSQKAKFEWKDIKICIDPEICKQTDMNAFCINKNIPLDDEVCIDGQKKCRGNILQYCEKGSWKDGINCQIIGRVCGLNQNREYDCIETPQGPNEPGRGGDFPGTPGEDSKGGVEIPEKKREEDKFNIGCPLGDTACLSSDPTYIYKCVFDQSLSVARYIPDQACSTQCEEINDIARCAQCKENQIICRDLFSYSKCEKQQPDQYLGWNQYNCPSNQKCLNNMCRADNRPLCDPGQVMCGSPQDWMQNQRTIYMCINGQWTEFQTCQNVCYKGECKDQIDPSDIDECTINGARRCTSDYLTVEECRAGKWVRIQNCIGDYYCSITGPDDAECVARS
ncbi:MAG: hypothetical protein QXV83_02000 [Candidatus Anstonellaceae archaeon]